MFDDVAPVTGPFQSAVVTNDNRLAIAVDSPHPFASADISVTRPDGSKVQLFENVPTDGAGIARVTTQVLPDGEYLIRARAGLYARYFFICEPGLEAFEAEGSLTFSVDTQRPTPTVSTTTASPTSSGALIPFTVVFSEPVRGFQATDAIVTNGVIQRVESNASAQRSAASGPTSFTFFVRPLAAGDVSLRIPANVAADAAANPNTASNPLVVTFDPASPALVSVTRQPASSGVTSADSLVYRATFSEAVLNVDAADFAAVGTTASVTGVVQVGPRVFDVTVAGGNLAGLNGPVSLAMQPGNNVADAVGNALSIQTPRINQRYFLDNTAPTVRIATITGTTNASVVPVTIVFSEPVTGFTLSDVVLTNAAASGFSGSGNRYSFLVAPQADGRVTIQVPAGAGSDPAGNGNLAANPASFVSDRTRPTIRLSSTAISPTNAAAIPIVAQFSEVVRGFTASDITVTNGTISGFTDGGASYRFNIIPAGNGRVTVAVGASVATDGGGNGNFASNGLAFISDTAAPTATVSTTSPSPTNSSLIPFRVAFSQAVSGFTAADLVVGNGTVTNFTPGGSGVYWFQVIPTADGQVTVRVPAGVAQDPAGNDNLASGIAAVVSDRTAPVPTLSTSISSPTNADSIPIRLQFSEAVTGLTLSDIRVFNGTASGLTGSGNSYQFNVAPLADGLVSIGLPRNVVRDAATNFNVSAAPLAFLSDRTAPTTSITTTSPNLTNAALIPFRIAFDEVVTGFAQGDIQVANGGIVDFIANGDGTFTVNVVPNGDGAVQLTVPAASAQDAAGNDNTAGSSSIVSDRTPPRATLSYNPPPANAPNLGTVTIIFTEPVTGFDITDLTLRFPEAQFPITANMLTGSGAVYTLDLTSIPSQPGEHELTLTAAGSNIFDLAGNAMVLDADTSWIPDFGNP